MGRTATDGALTALEAVRGPGYNGCGYLLLERPGAIQLRLLAQMPAVIAEPLLTFARHGQEDFAAWGGSR